MKVLVCLLLASVITPAYSAKAPQQGRLDPRIKNMTYSENDVYVVHGHYGYSTHIIFADDEVIEHLSPGDSVAWQFHPKKNHLFLQPVENQADTNLSLLTNKRMYNFELRAHEASSPSDASLSFLVKFRYPEDELQRELARKQQLKDEATTLVKTNLDPQALNFEYSMRGDSSIAPNTVFDDGQFTYFQFDDDVKTPAIFLVDANQQESLINFHVKGHYIVVQSTGAQFMLRQDQQATCIYNDKAPAPKALNQNLAKAT